MSICKQRSVPSVTIAFTLTHNAMHSTVSQQSSNELVQRCCFLWLFKVALVYWPLDAHLVCLDFVCQSGSVWRYGGVWRQRVVRGGYDGGIGVQ